MLNIITGRTGSGKTRYIRQLAADIAKKESGKAVIIVPEQFSFETERGMLSALGNEKINNVEILSFSRLAERLLSDYGKNGKKSIDDGARAVLMSMAIETVEDKLTVFSRYRRYPALIGELLDFYRELKKCCIKPESLALLSETVKKPSFAKKLCELSVIYECYESLVSANYGDDCTYLDELYALLQDVGYFNGKTVFLDAFSGFSNQEYNIIERIVSQSDELYVTFCCDTAKNNDRYELFYNGAAEIKKLKGIANRAGVKIAPEKVLNADEKYKKDDLNALEKYIYFPTDEKFEGDAENIKIISCRSKSDECDAVAAEIKRLVRTENYRYRDIAVIERTDGSYKPELTSAFRKYGVDCFRDCRQPVASQPLTVFMLTLFDILTDGFTSENVLRLLKTGLYGFTVEEIALIEDYCLMWNIRPSQWRDEWTENPEGFGVEFTDDSRKTLDTLNTLRTGIVAPVLSLKNKINDTDGETVSRELFMFLRRTKVDENLKALSEILKQNNETDLLIEQDRVWKIFTDIFDSLYFVVGKAAISIKRYRELFEIIVSTKDIGEIPNGIDEVIIGSADRIKAQAPKAVFIVGANTGVFPAESGGGVLLTDRERCELQENGAELVSNLEYNSVSERFIAYRAVTLATEKLFVSYSAMDSDSSSLTPSELVGEITRIFPDIKITEDGEYKIDKIESRKSAFSALAAETVNGSVLGTTLYDYFKNNGGTSAELQMIEKIRKKKFSIADTDVSQELFGRNMYISASKTEKFYKCPFEYFCEFGIKAKPRREAQLDPAQTGTLVHYALEAFLSENPKEKFVKFSENEIKSKIDEIIDDYVETKMGGFKSQNNAFLRSINLIKESTYNIVLQLTDEFLHCSFVPVDFELSVNNDGDIKPYYIELPDGGSVKIIGSVDRVDAYKSGENTFIRIIDYKTGGKEFKLSDVFSGLNMQMLIYLFAVWQNGQERYGNIIPAGILYFQAKSPRVSRSKLSRYDSGESVKAEIKKQLRMSGMVLNNTEVIDAMEKDGTSVFIPAGIDKNGNASGNVISLKSLQVLRNRVNSSVIKMAEDLRGGMIDALPTEDACTYCKYRDVCRHEEDDEEREIEKLSFKDALAMLGGDGVE